MDQPLDDAPGIGATVDIVAESDSERGSDRVLIEVTPNLSGHAVEQIGSTMDVADRVDPVRFR